jgi:hypothetical protein
MILCSYVVRPPLNLTCAMRYSKWIGLLAAIVLIIFSFQPWVFIESKNITVTGIHATGTNFGKPAWFHYFMVVCFLLCTFIPRIWAKRANFLVTALNLAWAIRNYFLITACRGGDCPEKKLGLYLVLLSSIIMLITALFPDMSLDNVQRFKARPDDPVGQGSKVQEEV